MHRQNPLYGDEIDIVTDGHQRLIVHSKLMQYAKYLKTTKYMLMRMIKVNSSARCDIYFDVLKISASVAKVNI